MNKLSSLLTEAQLIAVGRFFSSSVTQELARTGKSKLLARLLREAKLCDLFSTCETVGRFLDSAFSLLANSHYRHEYVFKDTIVRRVLFGRHSIRTAALLSEFRVDTCKADIAILNGTSTVYEIKSERDKLDRLAFQLNAYLKVFARVNVVTGEKHLKEVLAVAPKDVGILLLKNRCSISAVRLAVENTSRIIPEVLFESLQLEESARILRSLGVSVPVVPNTEMHREMRKVFIRLDSGLLHQAMVRVLKDTRSSLRLGDVIQGIPLSMRTAVLSTRIRRSDQQRLLAAMRLPFLEAMRWA